GQGDRRRGQLYLPLARRGHVHRHAHERHPYGERLYVLRRDPHAGLPAAVMASTRLRSGIQAFAARGLAAAAVLSLAACKHSRQEPSVVPAVTPTESKEAARQGPPPPSGAQKRIETLRLLVDRDPGDVKSWIALGNEYFDSGQRAKAIDAYGRALELQPNNPDVLTDQGVMYREL